MMTQSYITNGSTANNATVVNNNLKINHLSLGTYFIISVLLQYFSLNPAQCFPSGRNPPFTRLSKVDLLIFRYWQAWYLLILLSVMLDNISIIYLPSSSVILELPASISSINLFKSFFMAFNIEMEYQQHENACYYEMQYKHIECIYWNTGVVINHIYDVTHQYVVQKHPVINAEPEYICSNQDKQPWKQ